MFGYKGNEPSQSSSKIGSSSDSEANRGILVERRARLVERDKSVAGCESGGVINRIYIISISTGDKSQKQGFEHQHRYKVSNETWA